MEAWFIWATIGAVCIGLEMVMPGFVIFFFGMGALATALCSLIPFLSDLVWLQIILFLFFSTISLVLLRKRFTRIFEGTVFNPSGSNSEDDGIGEYAEVVEAIGAVHDGRIRFRGTTWKARSSGEDLPVGERVKIILRENTTYVVSSVHSQSDSTGGVQ